MRLRTSSLDRIRETCTLAVFSAMNSCAPISRLVAPPGEQGEHLQLARGEAEGGLLPVGVAPAARPASSSRRRRARAASPSTSSREPARAERAGGLARRRGRRSTVASRSPARRCASASREAGDGGGVRALERGPRLGRGGVERRVGLARGAGRRRRAALAACADGHGQVEVLGGGLHARVHHLRAQRGAALGLRVAEVAGALGGVGLDAHADAGHLGEPLAVLAAELDPVDRLLDDRARGVEVALAALELAAQRAAAGQELRLEREREDPGGLLQQRPGRARVAAAEQQARRA